MADILLIEPCDFCTFPPGGQLTFARQMMKTFGTRLALVGISTDSTPVGAWVKKSFDGRCFDYFAFANKKISTRRPLVPARLSALLGIKNYKKQIKSRDAKFAFLQAPEMLMAVQKWGWKSLCYRLPGVSNPLLMPRYPWGRIFARLYERKFLSLLKDVDTVLASAGTDAIAELAKRCNGYLSADRLIQFPTRVDTDVFFPVPPSQARCELAIAPDGPVVVTCGRLNFVKGWNFILEAFLLFRTVCPQAKLIYLGDGENRLMLETIIKQYGLSDSVYVTGFQPHEIVAKYLNAADLCVVGSYREGWSLAMLEALACGKPIVSTDVSGAGDMIRRGVNGFIVKKRDPKLFSDAMAGALRLKNPGPVSLEIAEKYALKNLTRDLARLWKPLA